MEPWCRLVRTEYLGNVKSRYQCNTVSTTSRRKGNRLPINENRREVFRKIFVARKEKQVKAKVSAREMSWEET